MMNEHLNSSDKVTLNELAVYYNGIAEEAAKTRSWAIEKRDEIYEKLGLIRRIGSKAVNESREDLW